MDAHLWSKPLRLAAIFEFCTSLNHVYNYNYSNPWRGFEVGMNDSCYSGIRYENYRIYIFTYPLCFTTQNQRRYKWSLWESNAPLPHSRRMCSEPHNVYWPLFQQIHRCSFFKNYFRQIMTFIGRVTYFPNLPVFVAQICGELKARFED